jgi:hypothetical protein
MEKDNSNINTFKNWMTLIYENFKIFFYVKGQIHGLCKLSLHRVRLVPVENK